MSSRPVAGRRQWRGVQWCASACCRRDAKYRKAWHACFRSRPHGARTRYPDYDVDVATEQRAWWRRSECSTSRRLGHRCPCDRTRGRPRQATARPTSAPVGRASEASSRTVSGPPPRPRAGVPEPTATSSASALCFRRSGRNRGPGGGSTGRPLGRSPDDGSRPRACCNRGNA